MLRNIERITGHSECEGKGSEMGLEESMACLVKLVTVSQQN